MTQYINNKLENKRQRIPKGQFKKDNPEKLAIRGTQDEDNQNNNTICIGHHNTQANTNNVNTCLSRYVNTVVWSSQITEIMYSNQKNKMKLVGKRLLYLKFEFCLLRNI